MSFGVIVDELSNETACDLMFLTELLGCFIFQPLKCSTNYVLLVLLLLDTSSRHSTVDPFHYIMLLLTPLFPLSHCTFSHCNHAHTFSAVVLFLISIYAVPLTHIVYTSSHKVLNLYVIQMFICTSLLAHCRA